MCPSGRSAQGEGTAGLLRPAFDVLDADRDGRIGRDDLKAFYSSSGATAAAPGGDDEAIGSMIAAADADRDEYVAFDEFERVVMRPAPREGGVMEEVFKAMDRDGDGRVGFVDLRSYMDWAGLHATDDDIRAMLRLAGGGEGDGGGVCYEGFVKILAVDSMGGRY